MNELAYRYATSDTFVKMLESQNLWFSDLRKMNDWDEYAAGFKIGDELITNEFPDYKHIMNDISVERMSSTFMMLICSFTTDGDLLSMWRAYAANGRGASIGYDYQGITNHHLFERYLEKIEPINGSVKFFRVIYEAKAFKETIRSHIQQTLESSSNLSNESPRNFKTVRTGMLRLGLARLFTLYKNEFFIDEREIRGLIEINKETDHYKLGTKDGNFGEAACHQVNTNLHGIPTINEVVLGPLCTLTTEVVREKLNECGLPDVKIRQSRGTYR